MLRVSTRDGVTVDQVFAGGAGKRLGLQPFDLLVKVNDKPIGNAIELQTTIRSLDANKPVSVLIFRAGKPMVLKADSLQPDDGNPQAPTVAPRPERLAESAEVPPSPELFKRLLKNYIERGPEYSAIAPKKVELTFEKFDVEAAQPEIYVTNNGKSRKIDVEHAPNTSFYPFKAQVIIKETYEGDVEYQYPTTIQYIAFVTPDSRDVKAHWLLATDSPSRIKGAN